MSRKHNINHSYFKNIDTQYKAYILGFIFADGSLIRTSENRQENLRIVIQSEDYYILTQLSQDVNHKNTINIVHPPSIKERGWKARAVLSIASNEICSRMVELGCNYNKTEIGTDFPQLPDELISHFIRGYFDGNGCIDIKRTIYKGKKISSVYFRKRVTFVSTDLIFLEKLFSYLPILKVSKTSITKKLTTYRFVIENKQDVDNFGIYIYDDANVFLHRKKDKFDMTIKSQPLDTFKEGLTTT